MLAYLLATFVYQIAILHYFDFGVYIQYLIRFNIAGPFYYVLLYIQLMLLKKVLVNVLNKMPCKFSVFFEILLGAIIIYICYFTTNYTNILDVYGGGGKLFGGTYLFIFYLGMIIKKHRVFDRVSIKKSLVFSIISIIAYYSWWRFMCIDNFKLDAGLPFGKGFNPPSISILILAVIVLCFAFGIFTLLERYKYTAVISNMVAWIGKHTLYIFLYHMFVLIFVLERHTFENINIKRIVYLSAMIFVPIFIEYIIFFVKKILLDEDIKQIQWFGWKEGVRDEDNAKQIG